MWILFAFFHSLETFPDDILVITCPRWRVVTGGGRLLSNEMRPADETIQMGRQVQHEGVIEALLCIGKRECVMASRHYTLMRPDNHNSPWMSRLYAFLFIHYP